MNSLDILNTKKIKKIMNLVKEQWDCSPEMDYAFLMNNENRIFIVNKDISEIDLSKIRINSMGLYFGELVHEELRLSLDGAQIIGPYAKKNVVELDNAQKRRWLRGFDIEIELKDIPGFVIIKSGDDYIGCSKYKHGKLLNFVHKTRRLHVSE